MSKYTEAWISEFNEYLNAHSDDQMIVDFHINLNSMSCNDVLTNLRLGYPTIAHAALRLWDAGTPTAPIFFPARAMRQPRSQTTSHQNERTYTRRNGTKTARIR